MTPTASTHVPVQMLAAATQAMRDEVMKAAVVLRG